MTALKWGLPLGACYSASRVVSLIFATVRVAMTEGLRALLAYLPSICAAALYSLLLLLHGALSARTDVTMVGTAFFVVCAALVFTFYCMLSRESRA